ncbi:MAG TPA: MarR family transcriptional regulator [Acidimicrobiales bacterium]|nr:MarR family transcriptional regulator [Acidimicrobiales bacterium]
MTVSVSSTAGAPGPSLEEDTDAQAALAARLRLAVTRLHRLLRQQVAGGLTPSQISALSTAERLGTPTLGELASAEQVQPPSMTRMAGALEAAGMLERLVEPADGRVVRVRVSPDGRRTLQRIRSLRNAVLAKRLRRLSDEEQQRLSDVVSLLERLVER